ncbi:hypothetical protein [Actinomadura latina]|uniref:Uncharacterized protein n=1 Tax=Actinomadura latina TaxID=163603 RepID=A0A846Z0P1_9ACTN|nr:hypothetical protein [Actinomadura latina]NKZ05487.1 hypothetical protein [Actinomadura latina]
MSATSGRRPSRSLVGTLGDLYRSRGLLLGLVATLAGFLLIVLAPSETAQVTVEGGRLVVNDGAQSLWAKFRIADIGAAVFQVGITLTIFQVLLNQIAEDRFVEHVRQILDEQQDDVTYAVVKSMAAGTRINDLRLSPAELDHVIENASRLRSGDAELGKVIARKLRTGVFESNEIWRNLVVRAEILELERATDHGRLHDYYNLYFQFAYYTTNVRRSRFAFRVLRFGDYDEALRAEDVGAVWRLPSTGEFDDDTWNDAFTLNALSFGGRPVEFVRSDVEREFVGHIPTEDFEDTARIWVQYSFTAKILADGNLLSFEVPKPTFGATYSISIGAPDIQRIRALDYFGATKPASIDYTPDMDHTRVVSISVDDWILPKAGVVVVWKRESPLS